MADASSFEDRWNELLKASRAWQLQWDVQQLLTVVARTAQELLGFDQTTVFLLEHNGVTEAAYWPQPPGANASPAPARLEIAQGVVQAGRMAFIRKDSAKRTIICTPLLASREIMGAIFLETTNPERTVTGKDQQFIEMFALQAAACLEHTRLYQSAITDPLTGLFSHRHFQQEVEQAIRRAMRNERPVALLLMDLDHFKKLNDTCGHSVGNQCLLQVAAALRKTFRSTDILARFGGDEFEVLLPDTAGDDAQNVAENLRKKICEMQFPQDRRVSATIGIACYPENATDAQTLFLCADGVLYKAKEAGRNRVQRAVDRTDEPNGPMRDQESAALRTGRLLSKDTENGIDAKPEKSAGVEMVDGHIVVRLLGTGSTGEVLLAIQPGLDREVALKRPLTPHQTFEQAQAFEQEAKVTASLNHPGIVPVHGIGRDHDSRRYYTMKPLSGLTLEDILESRRKGNMETLHAFTPGRLLEILQRVAETIAFAHESSVLHLDIRPSNIVVGKFGEVTVIDWATGSSSANKHSERGSNTELRLVGSPAYLAPELVRGGPKNKSAACDVFALGTLLYLLLTNQLPFHRETTVATLDALLKGEFTSPELAAAGAGIDSMLSSLCAEALSPDPNKRPKAQAFAQRLGLYIRHEADWTTIQFGDAGHPLVESEWSIERGPWRLTGDHWLFQDNNVGGDGIIVWNTPVPGSVRFTCEGWVDAVGAELGVIGHRPPIGSQNHRFAAGYFFQFGAEGGAVTKLARHEADALASPAGVMEPGRRYLIEMEYQDQEGLLHCAIDGKRVFSYRELFPFPGSQIGFYAFGPAAAHFRPLKLERQNWNLQIPALRAADRFYQYSHFAEAIQCYREIAAAMPGRPAGIEATLKIGMCHAALCQRDEARKSFHVLAGTALEPFALAEEAMLEAETDPPRSLEMFRSLFDRFPESQARMRIFEYQKFLNFSQYSFGSCAKKIAIYLEWNRIGATRFTTPTGNQIQCAIRVADLQSWLGQWNEALQEYIEFQQSLSPRQRSGHLCVNRITTLALAAGQEHLLPDNLQPEFVGAEALLHYAVRRNEVDTWLRPEIQAKLSDRARISLHFARRDIESASKLVGQWIQSDSRMSDFAFCYAIGGILARAGDPELLERFLAACRIEKVTRLYQIFFMLEYGNFENAVRLLDGFNPPAGDSVRVVYVLNALLSSLGFLQNPSASELSAQLDQILFGPELELAEMFLGQREPRPTERWPHPLWRPEWRLWLGLWLEAKGRKHEAIEVVTPSRDSRYGLTNCQPAIEALLKRLI